MVWQAGEQAMQREHQQLQQSSTGEPSRCTIMPEQRPSVSEPGYLQTSSMPDGAKTTLTPQLPSILQVAQGHTLSAQSPQQELAALLLQHAPAPVVPAGVLETFAPTSSPGLQWAGQHSAADSGSSAGEDRCHKADSDASTRE